MKDLAQVYFLMIIWIGILKPIALCGQKSSFQIAFDSSFIQDVATSKDSLIYILKGNISFDLRGLASSLSLVEMDKNGSVLRSFSINIPTDRKFFLIGNKISCSDDGTFYLILHTTSIGGKLEAPILVHLSKDFLILNTIYNFKTSLDFKTFFSEDVDHVGMRYLWTNDRTEAFLHNLKLVLVEHKVSDNSFVFSNYTDWNPEYVYQLNDAIQVKDYFFLINSVYFYDELFHHLLIKFNVITKENEIYRFNFNPNFIISDFQNNLIILGQTEDGQLIISKYTDQLVYVWSKLISFSKGNSDYSFSEKPLAVDEEGNIYINTQEPIKESNRGLKLLKLDKNGSLLYHKILLDATNIGLPNVKIFDDHLLIISQYLRKFSLLGEADDCFSIPVCSKITNFSAQIFKTTRRLVSLSKADVKEGITISLTPDETKTYPYCEPFLPPDPVFDVYAKQFCIGDSLIIDTSTVYPYGVSEWTLTDQGDTDTQTQKYPNPFVLDKIGDYTIQHRLIFAGCEYKDTLHINVVKPAKDLLAKKDTICENEERSIALNQDLASEVKWSDGTNSNSINVSEPGNYSVVYKDKNGCIKNEQITLDQILNPLVSLGEDRSQCRDSMYVIDIPNQENSIVRWSDGSIGFRKVITSEGLYTVTITNVCGEVSDEIYIDYTDCASDISYSNIFSPNNDGTNDHFVLMGNSISEVQIHFYDRWGNIVFSRDFMDGNIVSWDGKMNQKFVPPGVYVFILSYKENLSGKSIVINGNTTIVH